MREWLINLINIMIGFRKFLVILILYAVAIYMRIGDHLSGDQFVNLLKATTIAFFGANITEHAFVAYKNRQSEAAKPPQ